MLRSASPRLVTYAVLGVAGAFIAIASGQPAPMALVAAPALLALVGVVFAAHPSPSARLTIDDERVLEGDMIEGTVELELQSPAWVEVDVPVDDPHEGATSVVEPGGTRLAWSIASGTSLVLPLRMEATSWGLVRLGPVNVRVHGPLQLVRWEAALAPVRTVRVLPPAGTLRRLLEPAEARSAAGVHLTRRRADGLEFADVRPYAPGDRLRAVNWPVSSRRDDLWVNQRHPERSADIVIVVDTFADARDSGSAALVQAVRAAWLVASTHLAAQDRVGIVTFGGYPAWLPPMGGERARYAVLDRLLAAQAGWAEAQRSVRFLPRGVMPAGAAVVGISALHDRRMVEAFVDLRRRGLSVVVVEVDVDDTFIPADPDEATALAVRLWRLEQARRRDELLGAGAQLVRWEPGDDPYHVIDALAGLRRRRQGVLR
jgi:uncharacterized protein (DUF58 family)